MKKVCIVLEGGAMRGMYTAGVLDTFLDNNVILDDAIGVSAGALFGVNYFSKQRGRVIRYSKRFCKDLRYMSLLSLLFTGNIVNKNFAYYKVTNKLDPFDENEFKNSKCNYYAVVTNIKNGRPEYKQIKSAKDDMEILRATSAMPLVTKPVKINNELYLDGAISDSIPIDKALEMEYDKIIVILTRPLKYRKELLTKKQIKRIKRKYKNYPKLIDKMEKRPNDYNNTLEKIQKLEKDNRIFVVRPSCNLNVKVIERNKNKLEDIYNIGIRDANSIIDNLIEYLNK